MEDLVLFYPQGHEEHYEYNHPERPDRVETIREALMDIGWWESLPRVEPFPPPIDVLQAIHDKKFLHDLQVACSQGRHMDMDTYTTEASWDLAHDAVGGGIAIASKVWQREAKRGFALTRPPGHHATPNRAMGFCLLNNIALAAEYLIQKEGASRIAIVDLDLHHGNGTQDIFWQREDVLYISTHQFPHYPGSGNIREMGAGKGKGTTANFPMPPMSGDSAFLTVMEEAILPIMDRFNPEIILVSYGFDTHWRDPLGNLLLSAKTYGELIQSLMDFADSKCDGRVALFLEGGYDLQAAAACTNVIVARLLDQPWDDPIGPSPYAEMSAWKEMLNVAKDAWGL